MFVRVLRRRSHVRPTEEIANDRIRRERREQYRELDNVTIR